MDEVINAIRRAIIDEEEAGEMTSTSTSRERGSNQYPRPDCYRAKQLPQSGSAFNTLTEAVKKHEPTLEDVVRDTLRPMLKSWLDENLPSVVERTVPAEIERITRGR